MTYYSDVPCMQHILKDRSASAISERNTQEALWWKLLLVHFEDFLSLIEPINVEQVGNGLCELKLDLYLTLKGTVDIYLESAFLWAEGPNFLVLISKLLGTKISSKQRGAVCTGIALNIKF